MGIVLGVAPTDAGEGILFVQKIRHLAPSLTVYGLLSPDVVADRERRQKVLERLFDRNGAVGHPIFFEDAPTFVPVHAQEGLNPLELRDLTWRALRAMDFHGLERACQALEMYPCHPWGRMAFQRRAVVEKARHVFKGNPKELQAWLERSGPGGEPLSEATFERWWRLVTDEEHIKSEGAALAGARRRAKARRYRQRMRVRRREPG
ncbi:MAG: hypothetical protein U0167_00615 [bacterium]